jgi:hypothetical protein
MPAPKAVRAIGDTFMLLTLTAADPTEVTVGEEDATKVGNGDTLLLTFDPPNEDLSGSLGIVANLMGSTFVLEGVDLSEVDTEGITVLATVQDIFEPPEPPDPEPGPGPWNPYPSPGSSPNYYPSPGYGPVPVEPHPDAGNPARLHVQQERAEGETP